LHGTLWKGLCNQIIEEIRSPGNEVVLKS